MAALRRLAFIAAASVALHHPAPAGAQTPDPNLWSANGPVHALTVEGNTLWIGGDFTSVGPATGSAAPVSAATGLLLPPTFPKVFGTVLAVARDGAGGWFIGGNFQSVGGVPRNHLAHVHSDMTVDPWNPNPNNAVLALVRSGSTLYVGGSFVNFNNVVTRYRLAAFDAVTGALTPWDPSVEGAVYALALDGSTLYVGGDFSYLGAQVRSKIGAIDVGTATPTNWDPGANGLVRSLAVSGSTVFAGGAFSTIGGQFRDRIAALDAVTGSALSGWDPVVDDVVYDLLAVGPRLYAAGQFVNVDGQPRRGVVALNAATGEMMAWDANANDAAFALEDAGSAVYVGGRFTTIGGEARARVAAIDTASAFATAWDPSADGEVYLLDAGGGQVFIGGAFTVLNGVPRARLAALDLTTGAATAWDPGADNTVNVLVKSGTRLYAAGAFTTIGGAARGGLAALDAGTDLATAWDPAPNGVVHALAVDGGTVYAGGAFTSIGGQARNRIAALGVASGVATAWNPNPNGVVYSLAVNETRVYAGGVFDRIGGIVTGKLTAIDRGSALPLPVVFNAFGIVRPIMLDGPTARVGGNFLDFNGAGASGFDQNLDFTGWSPSFAEPLWAIAKSGTTIYLGGEIRNINGFSYHNLAATDEDDNGGNLPMPDWLPSVRGNYVHAVAVQGAWVYAGGDFTSVQGVPQARIARITAFPFIESITPSSGGNAGKITAWITGSGLPLGATVKLRRSGQPDIPGTQVTVAADALGMGATFDLRGVQAGTWDVVVTTPDNQVARLVDGFTVVAPAPYDLRVSVVGPVRIRPNRLSAFDVIVHNQGNNDALDVPLWITGIPAGTTVVPDFTVLPPPQSGGEPDWNSAPFVLDGFGGRYAAFVLPRLRHGSTVWRFRLSVPYGVNDFELGAAVGPPWSNGQSLLACLTSGGVTSAGWCVGQQLDAIEAFLAAPPDLQALNGVGLWAKIGWRCGGATTLPAALAQAQEALDFMAGPVVGAAVPSGCEVNLVPRWQDRRFVTVVTSVDPNEKLGLGGVGVGRRIGGETLMPYSIRFENLETATAPAQEVLVVDALDQTVFDPATVSLGPIAIGPRTLYPPPGLTGYAADLDLRPAQDLIVRVGVTLDVATGVLTWSFSSVDPATGAPPEDPDMGFLPPNVTPPEGEGSVQFTIMPKPGLAAGAAIRNKATISFDGASLETPDWENHLDITAPESAVLPLPSSGDSAVFTVRWEAIDSPPDLRDYSVYVSENGGDYRPWRVNTTATADTFAAKPYTTYAFYSLARDSSGNLETAPESPDAQTTWTIGVTGGWGPALALEGATPNPATGDAARIWFTLPSAAPAVLEVVDVAGRRVLRREVGAMGPGRHVVDVAAATRAPGLYLLTLSQGGRTLHSRMIALR